MRFAIVLCSLFTLAFVAPAATADPEGDAAPPRPRCTSDTVHFDYDSSSINVAAQAVLERYAKCVVKRTATMTITGHTDARRTAEYALALGEKRARAVARYLEKLGVPKTRLRTRSMGKEAPVCKEDKESCHARNRRVELPVVY